MTVTSLSYLLFVFILLALAWAVRSVRARQTLFLAASYVFYASWSWSFLWVLVASSLLNYGLGILIRRRPTVGRLWLGVSANLLLLIVFKYLPPLLLGASSDSTGLSFLHGIVMPVGISFWTFQALSYLFDLYREEELDPSLLEFSLYLSFWPTVLAGPVCRLGEMLPQFRKTTALRWTEISLGGQRILTGLFMKMVLAQLLAAGFSPGEGVAAGFDQINRGWGGLDVWLLAIGYGFQLFFDFAGYSHIVIGTALLFGIRLQENFDRPYFSTTPSMFWTRWHMSLSFWVRDYIFMPLATLKRAMWWRHAALVLAMTLFGLWHGATPLFLLWGAYHGSLLVGHRKLQQLQRGWKVSLPAVLSNAISWGATFALVSLGWILFRAHDLQQALAMLSAVFTPSSYRHLALRPNFYILTSLVVGAYFAYDLITLLTNRLGNYVWSRRLFTLLSPVRYAVVIFLTIIWSKQEAVFVYFQF
ncbi:MAG TPA: MBOAT family O-acyltransferase [Pyrinomonadaceae bacterium]|jgi:alginate O-acetyltransferase complex protein AlgI|nr:MBOAT family O-acyltransferase [Pyrinomonadaceae bacterium]